MFTSFQDKKNKGTSLEQLAKELEEKKTSQFSHLSYVPNLEKLEPLSTNEMHHATKALLCRAESEILMQFYKFHPDCDAARLIFEAFLFLKDKAELNKKAINVKIIVNSRGKIAQTFYRKNESNVADLMKKFESEFFRIEFKSHLAELFGSYHSKFIVVDREEAMLRGTDVGRNDNFKNNRHESAMLVDKNLAGHITRDFLKSWESLSHREFKEKEIVSLRAPREKSETKAPDIPCIFITKNAMGNPMTQNFGPLKIALLRLTKKAKSSIKIITANINDPEIIAALADACMRGVKVKIVMGKYHNDKSESKFGGTNSQSMRKLVQLIDSDSIKNLDVRWATDADGLLVRSEEVYAVHTKYMCVDDKLVATGSSPLDRQAMYNSREADIIFDSAKKAEEFNRKFFNYKYDTGIDYFADIKEGLIQLLENQTALLQSSPVSSDKHFASTLATTFKKELDYQRPDLSDYNKIKGLLAEIKPLFFTPRYYEMPSVKAVYEEITKFIKKAGISEKIKSDQPIELIGRRIGR